MIYFILTQKPIIEDTFLGVNLPAPGSSTKRDKPIQLFTVDVMSLRDTEKSPDYYHVNGKGPWYIEDLRTLLIETAENDPDQTIVINCGPNARHRKLIQLLDACAEAGLKKLNIVNDESVRFVPATAK